MLILVVTSDASFDGSSQGSFGSLGDSVNNLSEIPSTSSALSSAYPWCLFNADPAVPAQGQGQPSPSHTQNGRRAVSVGPPSVASTASLDSGDFVVVVGSCGSAQNLNEGLLTTGAGYVRRRYGLSRRSTQESLSGAQDGNGEATRAREASTVPSVAHGASPSAKLALGLIVDLGADAPAQE